MHLTVLLHFDRLDVHLRFLFIPFTFFPMSPVIYETPSLPNSVIYQIYPRSFRDSNGDGIGDINGIIQGLDYLNDGTEHSLGVDAIWLSPIYKSPMFDFGYDVSDHCDIDPIFGSIADFDMLVKEAHRRNVKIILDFIPNHTSHLHPWFLESRSSKINPKRDWYIWRGGKEENPPTNWLSRFGGSGWEYDPTTNEYYYHSFLSEQPDLNWANPYVQEAMENVLQFWLDRGVDGFRVDAVEHMIKSSAFQDELANDNYRAGADDPFHSLTHTYTLNQPEIIPILKSFKKLLSSCPGSFMINEMNVPLDELINIYKSTDGICMPFNFHLMHMPWDHTTFKSFIDAFDSAVGKQYTPNYVLGNHDTPRLLTRLNEKRARVAAMLQLTLRGMPFIYYGDELGLPNGIIPPEKVRDPWEKKTPGLGLGRDPARTPIVWEDAEFGGFSNVEPWLPFADKTRTVLSERQNTSSMFNLYRTLIHARKKFPALLSGDYQPMQIEGKPVLAFRRIHGGDEAVVVLNFSENEQEIQLDTDIYSVLCTTYLDQLDQQKKRSQGSLFLRPHEGYVLTRSQPAMLTA